MAAGMVSPLQGFDYWNALTQGGALSRFALCYNISPLQGFDNAPLCGDGLGDSRFRGNGGMGGNDGRKRRGRRRVEYRRPLLIFGEKVRAACDKKRRFCRPLLMMPL